MTTKAYDQLEDGPIDSIDAAVFNGDIFLDVENATAFRQMMKRWEHQLQEYDKLAEDFLLKTEKD